MFLEESLFLPPQEKGQVRGQPVATSPVPYSLPLTSPGSSVDTANGVRKILSKGFTAPLALFRWPARGPMLLPCPSTRSSRRCLLPHP